MTFSIFDFIVFAIIAISSLFGLYRGFIYITINLIGFVCSIALTVSLYPITKDILSAYINNELGLSLVSGAGIYIISLIICTLLTSKIISLFNGSDKSFFNRFLGLLIGFLRGVLFVTIIFIIAVFATTDSSESEDLSTMLSSSNTSESPKWLANSKTTIYLQKVAKYVVSIIPEDIANSIKPTGNEDNLGNEENVIDAVNRRKKNNVKSTVTPANQDLKNSIEEVTP